MGVNSATADESWGQVIVTEKVGSFLLQNQDRARIIILKIDELLKIVYQIQAGKNKIQEQPGGIQAQ